MDLKFPAYVYKRLLNDTFEPEDLAEMFPVIKKEKKRKGKRKEKRKSNKTSKREKQKK